MSPPPKSPLPLLISLMLLSVSRVTYSTLTPDLCLLYSVAQERNTGNGELPPEPTKVMPDWAKLGACNTPITKISASDDTKIRNTARCQKAALFFGEGSTFPIAALKESCTH